LLNGKPISGRNGSRGGVPAIRTLPWRTALENVEFGLELRKLKPKERREQARAFLGLVGLSGFENRHPHVDEAVCLGQRVAVMTSRPGRIKTIIDIPESLKYGDHVRSRPEYGAVRHEVWSRLRDEVRARTRAGAPKPAPANRVNCRR
jgi:ABC-type nitrate/sulfonate/bicarbonate transport system ATPase subunit